MQRDKILRQLRDTLLITNTINRFKLNFNGSDKSIDDNYCSNIKKKTKKPEQNKTKPKTNKKHKQKYLLLRYKTPFEETQFYCLD